MKIIQLMESERIKEGLRSLTEEFIEEYPYYSTWIEKNEATFKDGTRVVYELNDNEKTVGYIFLQQTVQRLMGSMYFLIARKEDMLRKLCYRFLKNLENKTTIMHLSKPVLITRLWCICLIHWILM